MTTHGGALASPAALPAGSGARILVVDDEPANLVALEAVLAPLGEELVPAASAGQALRELLRREFALVLLDVRMPDMGGIEVAELIRSRPSMRALPIIFLTAYGEAEESLQRAYGLGAADFIFKPIDPDFLRAKVGVFVQLYRQQRRMSELLVEAEAASRAKSEFLRMAAHELRTPLAVLTGYVSMLRDGTFGPAPDSWASPLDVLRRKSRELTTLVNDILETARIEAGATVAVPYRFDARRAVEAVVSRSQEQAREVGGKVGMEVPEAPVWVHADPEQVARILDNLLENALTYSRGRPRVHVGLHAGEQALIEVCDEGIGIPAELREKVFERFFRIDDPDLAMRPGTGLGLYISRELAHRNGGGLMVADSTPGRGTRIALSLPLDAV